MSCNAYTTLMSALLHSYFVYLSMYNKLFTPLQLTVLFTPIYLSQFTVYSYIFSSIAYHITSPARPTLPARRTG